MTDSILDSVKKVRMITVDNTDFDDVLIMHINTAFAELNQAGIGPDDGFAIEDNTAVWATFLGDNLKLNNVKTYVCLVVEMIFDPPAVWHLANVKTALIAQSLWRINVERELATWVEPTPPQNHHHF